MAGIDLAKDAEHRAQWLAALAAHPRTTVVGRDAHSLTRVTDAAA